LKREDQERYVILIHLGTMECNYDPHQWGGGRTMCEAHKWIVDHWDEVVVGQVVDVQFILGETPVAKVSER
jgi:hypothetical protein